MRMRSALLGIVFVSTIASIAGQSQLRQGEYEVTVEIDNTVSRRASYEAGYHKEKRFDCFAADLLKGPTEIAQLFASEADKANCKVSDIKTAGNKVTIQTTCTKDDVRTSHATELTLGTDFIASLTEVRDDKGAATTIRITANRVGDCRKPS